MKLKTARWQETYTVNESEWHTPTIKIAALREYDGRPIAIILDEDSMIYDDVNKRDVSLEEILQLDITDAVASMTFDEVAESIYYCEVVIIEKWRKKRR